MKFNIANILYFLNNINNYLYYLFLNFTKVINLLLRKNTNSFIINMYNNVNCNSILYCLLLYIYLIIFDFNKINDIMFNFIAVIYLYIFIYINIIKNDKYNNKQILNNYILSKYYVLYISRENIFNIINIFVYNIIIFIKWLFNIYKYNILNNFINIFITKKININWYPIYKTYSIYGFFIQSKSNNKNFKNENFKNIKY